MSVNARWIAAAVALCAAAAGLCAVAVLCSSGEQDLARARAKEAARGRGDIMIGAAGPWANDYGDTLWKGMELALGEINAAGGIRGRKIGVIREDDESDVTKAQRIAQAFAEDTRVVAVLGHVESYVSNAVAVLYEHNGILMITPFSTSPRLTQRGFRHVFRAIPDDTVFGRELADFCLRRELRRPMIYHIQNDYGSGLANAFEMRCEELRIDVPDRRAYDLFGAPNDFGRDMQDWKENYTFDSIFLVGVTPQAAQVVTQIRKAGIGCVIVGGDGLDSPELVGIAGKAAEGVFVGSTFHPNRSSPQARGFVENFRAKYAAEPDASAAQGYDCVKVFAHAVEKAGSTVPSEMAAALRATEGFDGVTGRFAFDEHGNLKRDSVCLKIVRNGILQHFEPDTPEAGRAPAGAAPTGAAP